MHQRAAEADIVIVNHHLFFADLAVRRDQMAQILPDYTAVIFDEAHEIEDVAGQYFGFQVSTYQVMELRRDIATLSRARKFGSEELDRILIRLEEISLSFFGSLPGGDGRASFTGREEFLDSNNELYADLVGAFDLLMSHLQLIQDAPQEVIPLFRRAAELRQALQFLIEGDDPTFVYWIDRRGRTVCFSRRRRSMWRTCCASSCGKRWTRRC